MSKKCKFSIVIPYWNKRYPLKLVLKSFTMQSFPKENFEIVIIDDGSDEKIDDLIERYKNELTIRYFHFEHTGIRGLNRNRGAELANGQYIIFIDGDMVPDIHLIKNFDSAIIDETVVLLGTRKQLLKFDERFVDDNLIGSHFEILGELPAWNDDRTISINFTNKTGLKYDGNWQILYSHCFCMSKDTFLKAGGFDDDFSRNWGAEDVELGYRLWKMGCKINLVKSVLCYHIHHPTDPRKNISSLKKNYSLFLKKHCDWRIELFTREFEYWPIDTIYLQNKIINREHLVSKLQNVDKINISESIIVFGIDNEMLLSRSNVLCALNPNSINTSEKVLNILGITTKCKEKEFKYAIISEKYSQVDIGLFEMLKTEASRIADKIILLNDGEDASLAFDSSDQKEISQLKKNKVIGFTLANDTNYLLNRYNFLNLAIAFKKIGVNVSVELGYDPYRQVEINTGYLWFSSPIKKEIINNITNYNVNFIGDQVPRFMDIEIANFTSRGLGHRILWEDIVWINHEKYFMLRGGDSYDLILCRREWEKELYSPFGTKTQFLPVGLDKDKLLPYVKSKKSTNGITKFLWAEQFTEHTANLDILVEEFIRLFGNSKDVQLVLALPDNRRTIFRGEYYNDTHYQLAKNTNQYFINDEVRKQAVIKQCVGIENIQIINNITNDEELTKLINSCDYFISLNSTMKMNPLVIEAIALGKKIIIPDDKRYSGYIHNNEQALRVEVQKTSALFSDPLIENTKIHEENCLRYFLVHKPLSEDINLKLKQAVDKKHESFYDERSQLQYIDNFDWIKVAEIARSYIF